MLVTSNAEVAQLVEHLPSKQNVAGPSPVFRFFICQIFGPLLNLNKKLLENYVDDMIEEMFLT